MAHHSLESPSQPNYEDFFDDVTRLRELELDAKRLGRPERLTATRSALASGALLSCIDMALFLTKAPPEIRGILGDATLTNSFVTGFLAYRSSAWRKLYSMARIDRKYSLPELPKTHPDNPKGMVVVSPLVYRCPPEQYGGIERDINTVVHALGREGIRAFVFATATSTVAEDSPFIELIPVLDEELIKAPDQATYADQEALARERIVNGAAYLLDQGQADMIDVWWEDADLLERLAELAISRKVPIHMHLSNTPNDNTGRIRTIFQEKIFSSYTGMLSTISSAHREGIEEATGEASSAFAPLFRMPYGISFEGAPAPMTRPLASSSERPTLQLLKDLQDEKRDYIIHPGTIGPRKSQAKTIEAFRLAKDQGYLKDDAAFIIMGEPSPAHDDALRYHQEYVWPQVNNEDIFYFGPANESEKWELLKFALASMFASGMEADYTEAFCRLLIECAGVGPPVVGFGSNTFREVIVEGVTGLSFMTTQEAAEQLGAIHTLDRTMCANYAREMFSEKRMVSWHLLRYRHFINQRKEMGRIT